MLLCTLLVALAGFSLSAQDASREYRETYDVKQGMTLSADIKYADVELVNWDRDEVDVLAEVKVDASSQAKAEEHLDKIDVRISKSGNTIFVETDFEEGWSNRVKKVDIHFTVQAPSYLNLTMDLAYGDLFVQELDGLVLLDLKYGNLKAGTLGRGNEKPYNTLELAYSDGEVDRAGWAQVELAYSELDVHNATMLFAECKYSKLMGEAVGGIVAEGAYDKYQFDRIDNFVAELKYSGVRFGSLAKKFEVEAKYTNIKLDHVDPDFKQINALSSYGNIYLGMEPGASYKLEAETKYGKIDLDAEGKLSKSKDNNYMKVWGTVGTAPKGSINLEARYGNITID